LPPSPATIHEPAHDGFGAKCPAHDDNEPSLKINVRDGKVLLHCLAGCPTARVGAGFWDHIPITILLPPLTGSLILNAGTRGCSRCF
jgi:hypothetical protein